MKPAPYSQSGPIATPQGCWLWLLECIIFFLLPTSSSHLDPAATPHSTLQGSSAVTPEHPSVIDPLMEQDEGPGSPPAKQSTPSSRSALAMLWTPFARLLPWDRPHTGPIFFPSSFFLFSPCWCCSPSVFPSPILSPDILPLSARKALGLCSAATMLRLG